MGFLLQILSNGGSRLIYMYLLGVLNQLDVNYASPHASLLANANGLSAIFCLNAYQYYVAQRTGDADADLTLCETQFKLLFASLLAMLAVTLGLQKTEANLFEIAPTIASAIALALPELTFTMATARDKPWRALALYGGHSVFFLTYTACVRSSLLPAYATAWACTLTVFLSLVAFVSLRASRATPPPLTALMDLAKAARFRFMALIASLPVIATPPAMIWFMSRHPETAAQIPQMLLFSSFVGALVFLMGNVFNYYGRDLLPGLLELQSSGQRIRLFTLLVCVLLASTLLTLPVDLLLRHIRHTFPNGWAADWYIFASLCAAGTVILQWYTVVCMHHGDTRPVLWANMAYLMLACTLTATTSRTGMHVFATLACCAVIRSVLNITDFSLAGRHAWRT